MYKQDPWKNFRYKLESFERDIKHLAYPGAFKQFPDIRNIWSYHNLPSGCLTLEQARSLLTTSTTGPPHGVDLLVPVPVPTLPKPPIRPSDPPAEWHKYTIGRADKAEQQCRELKQQFEEQFRKEAAQLGVIREGCGLNDLLAIRTLMGISHARHWLPEPVFKALEVDIDPAARMALCTVEIPDFKRLSIVKKRGDSFTAKWLPVSEKDRKSATENVLYSLCLRAAYLVVKSDIGNWFDSIAVNAKQNWFDPATGAPREGIIASIQALKDEIENLKLELVDPKECFRHFKGIATPSVDNITPIRPIFVMNTADHRIIENRDVDAELHREANLAAMPWEDFEQLVRQLFEWEFGKAGVEVKVTRASRDRGVDAIMFDPDPLRGGKYVLQAKRYTRPVDVAAVRDLYGTVMNEGANRGILVTTSSYGPDSYDFAKDKPISLVDGPNLIAMLRRHGRMFRIDLTEARSLENAGQAAAP